MYIILLQKICANEGENEMKHIKRVLLALCLVVAMAGFYSTTVEAAKNMTIKSEVQSTNKIKLTWKKQKGVKGYKIYRVTEYSNGNSKRELIATLGKKKTSFVDKKVKANQHYNYTIYAYYYKNGKQKNKYQGWTDWVETSLTKPSFDEFEDWDEGIYEDVKTTPNQIKIPIGSVDSVIGVDVFGSSSIKPDGIEVFKKVGKKYVSYKKIKIKNKKKKIYYFTDKNVKKGKKYKYKFRTYKKINGKMIYSKKTNAFTVCAMNNYTALDVAITKPFDIQEKTMEISISNNTDYGNFTDFYSIYYYVDDMVTYYSSTFDIVAYSTDQLSWNTEVNTCKIKPGKTIYLRLKENKTYTLEYESEAIEKTEGLNLGFKHKFYNYYMEYDIINNKQYIYHE